MAAAPVQLDSVVVHAYNITPGPLGATLSSFAVDAGIAARYNLRKPVSAVRGSVSARASIGFVPKSISVGRGRGNR